MSIRTSTKNYFRASRVRWSKYFGLFGALQNAPTYDKYNGVDYAGGNDWPQKVEKYNGQNDQEVYRIDTDNILRWGGECTDPMMGTINFPLSTSASQLDQVFFIAPFPMRVTSIVEKHGVANGATMTGYVEHLTGTQALGGGVSVQVGTFNLNGTANTNQSATLPSQYPATASANSTTQFKSVFLATGDRLAFQYTGTLTSLAGVVVSIGYAPGAKQVLAVYNMNANAGLVDTQFFLALQDMKVTAAYCAFTVLGTDASAVNVQITKDTSTNAPGAGTDLLTNSTNAGFNLKSAINTVQTGALTATAATLRLAPGNRLSVDFAGTLTAVAGLVVVVVMEPVYGRKFVSLYLQANAAIVDNTMWVSDRNYYVDDAMAVWSTAAASGNVQLTKDIATDAVGAGVDLLSNDSSAGFQVDGTAQTPERATWINTQANHIKAGDRLSLDMAVGASIVGLLVTVALIPE